MEVFKELLEQDLQETLGVVNDYLDNPILLRDWIATLGRIYDVRCHGVEYFDSAGEDTTQEPHSITYDQAGVPTMIQEVCVTLLEAGFLPKTSRFLREKMKQVLINACEKISNKLHISIPKSTTMICVADDLGILEEDEVSIRFGKPFRDEETGRNRYYITGDVLVARVNHMEIVF
jgi:RNA dependent RNA polymerase